MILFLTQYYNGIGHAQRISLIANTISQDTETIFVDHLYRSPVLLNDNVKRYNLIDGIPPNKINVYNTLLLPEAVEDRITKFSNILNENSSIKVAVLEGFPFCRHQFAYEFFVFLQELKKRNIKLVCSIRDFPWDEPHDRSVRDWIQYTQALIVNSYFDKLLVHSDPTIMPLVSDLTTLPGASQSIKLLNDKLVYTGYVVNNRLPKHNKENNRIIISTGYNKEERFTIFQKIADIAPKFPNMEFLLVNGISSNDNTIKSSSVRNIKLVNYIEQLGMEIAKCAMYISYGGYNSTFEIIQTKTPAIIIPRQHGEKQEQRIRTALLAKHNLFKVVLYDDLDKIGFLIGEMLYNNYKPASITMNLNGIQGSVDEIRKLL